MKLTSIEIDRLWIFVAAELARRRQRAGLKLNCPEAVAIITDEVMEAARHGRTYEQVQEIGYTTLSEEDVLDGVAEIVDRIQIEPLFEDGTQLVTLHHPIRTTIRGRRNAGQV